LALCAVAALAQHRPARRMDVMPARQILRRFSARRRLLPNSAQARSRTNSRQAAMSGDGGAVIGTALGRRRRGIAARGASRTGARLRRRICVGSALARKAEPRRRSAGGLRRVYPQCMVAKAMTLAVARGGGPARSRLDRRGGAGPIRPPVRPGRRLWLRRGPAY